MNQTRSFLLIAWLLVAGLLWMEWNKVPPAPAQPTAAATDTSVPSSTNVPANALPANALPAAPSLPSSFGYLSGSATGTTDVAPAPSAIASAGNSQPHNNIMPVLALNYIIALEGVYPSQN